MLRGRFSRNQFEVCQERFVDLCDIDQSRMLSIREAVSIGSLGGGQGFIKCNCSGSRENMIQTEVNASKTTSNATVSATTACLVQISESKEQIILCQFGSCFLQPHRWGVLSLLVRMFSFYFHLLALQNKQPFSMMIKQRITLITLWNRTEYVICKACSSAFS